MISGQTRLAVLSMHTSPTAALGQSANGGMNVYIRQVCTAFSRCGISTDVFTRRLNEDDPVSERLAPLSRVVYLPAGPFETDKYGLLDRVPAFTRSVLEDVRERELEYDLIYSHYWLSGAVASRLSPALNLPWVHTAHTLGLVKNRRLAPGAEPEPYARIAVEQTVARKADLLIASTAVEAEDLEHLYGVDPARITVVAPGIDLSVFGPMDKTEAQRKIGYPAQRLLLFVGRLERLKGAEVVLRALAQLTEPGHRDLRLLVVGEDSRDGVDGEKNRLRTLARELGIATRVDFLGPVAHHELPYFYAAAEACVMPSYSESFGLVGLEAQACGCPVVAANVAGLASVVREGSTGFLVDGHDPAAYADRIKRLLDDEELAAKLGQQGVAVAQRYPWARTTDRIWAAMGSVLEPAPAVRVARPF